MVGAVQTAQTTSCATSMWRKSQMMKVLRQEQLWRSLLRRQHQLQGVGEGGLVGEGGGGGAAQCSSLQLHQLHRPFPCI